MSYKSREYNNLFCFSAIGIDSTEGFQNMPAPSNLKICGRSYHRMLSTVEDGPLYWYVHDPQLRSQFQFAMQSFKNVSIIGVISLQK